MGDYNLEGLDTREFEHMVQSLVKKSLGDKTVIFGDGPDGGREVTFEGKGKIDNSFEYWDGYWVIQAKFKQRDSKSNNFMWIKKNLKAEMKKIESLKKEGKKVPNNYLFFTNVILTPVQETGLIDKLSILCESFKHLISNIKIIGYDDICKMLDNNRDVATAYSSFIRSGDVLEEVFKYFNGINEVKLDYTDLLANFLQKEFKAELYSHLRQAGDSTDDRIHLEHVFIDLYATKYGVQPNANNTLKFVDLCMNKGNSILRPDFLVAKEKNIGKNIGFVLVGDAGFGKSTLTQFLCQTYRAYFINNIERCKYFNHDKKFIEQFCELEVSTPSCIRFPFKIVLKDYAGWIIDQKKNEVSYSVLSYIQHRIRIIGDGEISKEGLRSLLKKLSFLYVFDGLDEVPATSNRSDIIKEINHFIDVELLNNNCDALIVATTRPQGYNNDFEQLELEELQITTLSVTECKKYLNKLINQFSEDIDQINDIKSILHRALADDTISKLMETPLQATIMAMLVKIGGEPPRNKFDLFSNYVDIMIKRERQKKVLSVINELSDHIKKIHYNLGFMLQKDSEEASNPSSSISQERFSLFIREYFMEEAGYTIEMVDNYISDIMEAIETRLAFISKTTDHTVGFSVRSLQEYFAAMHLMVDKSDEDIQFNLRKISTSSYWRRTLLFTIGYIKDGRKNFITFLHELCREMNGEEQDMGILTDKNLALLGSWLALDILIDGVFSTLPKHENMFSRHIEHLFKIAPMKSHVYFSRLSLALVERTLIPLIEKYIISHDKIVKLTTLTIASYSLRNINNSKIIELIALNWNEEDEILYLNHLAQIGLDENEWFIEKLIKLINLYPKYTFHDLINSENIIKKLVSKSSNESIKWILIENLFLELLKNRFIHSNTHVAAMMNLMDIPIDTEVNDSIYSTSTVNEVRVVFVKDYEAHSPSIFSVEAKFLSSIRDHITEQSNSYIVIIINFLLKPNKKTLEQLFVMLLEEDEKIFDIVSNYAPYINWLLVKVFAECKNKNDIYKIIEKINSNYYGDIEEWKYLEEQFKDSMASSNVEALNYLVWRNSGLEDHMDEFYNEFYSKILISSDIEKSILENELLRAFSLFKFETIDEKILDSIINILLYKSTSDIGYYYLMEAWIKVLQYSTPEKLLKLFLIKDLFDLDIKFEGYRIRTLEKKIPVIFEKIFGIIYALNSENNFIRFLPYFIYSQDDDNKIILENYYYQHFHNTNYKNSFNESSRILLCLTDRMLSTSELKHLIKSIEQQRSNDPGLLDKIIFLFENYKLNAGWMGTLIVAIYEMVDCHVIENYELLKRYLEYTKLINEGMLTDF